MDKKYITIIGLVVAGAIFFSLVVMPMIKENRTQKYFAEQSESFDSCMQNAWDNYDSNWENVCKNLDRKESCLLPNYLSQDLEDRLNEAKITCGKLYK